jgi:hypothetical protein
MQKTTISKTIFEILTGICVSYLRMKKANSLYDINGNTKSLGPSQTHFQCGVEVSVHSTKEALKMRFRQ